MNKVPRGLSEVSGARGVAGTRTLSAAATPLVIEVISTACRCDLKVARRYLASLGTEHGSADSGLSSWSVADFLVALGLLQGHALQTTSQACHDDDDDDVHTGCIVCNGWTVPGRAAACDHAWRAQRAHRAPHDRRVRPEPCDAHAAAAPPTAHAAPPTRYPTAWCGSWVVHRVRFAECFMG